MHHVAPFKTKQGHLTAYGLACGYIEQRDLAPGVQVTLWHEGGPLYHVRAHDHNTHVRLFWFTSPSLKECRKVYRQGHE